MIKVYSKNDLDKKEINKIVNDPEHWSFPIEELDYLLLEHKEESFLLIDNRLYELEV